jgi:hypothetical protein
MVMLDLIKKAGFKLPIIFFREPFFPKKYEFANKIILDNEYSVYDYPPIATGVRKKNDNFEIINFHQIFSDPLKTIYLPTGVVNPNGSGYLCGLNDIVNKPKVSNYDFIWNTIFIGHKSSDIDPVLGGTVELKVNKFTDEKSGKTFIFPLQEFTDEDIWNYTLENKLPINDKRYDINGNFKELKNLDYNPDYFPTCVKCIDRDNASEITCPKTGELIPNISDTLLFVEIDLSHYTKVKPS